MSMTLRLTDADAEALKRQAEREGVSMQTVAQNAIRGYLAADVDQALDVLTPRYQNLLDRLGTV
jgi:hypothetical protein